MIDAGGAVEPVDAQSMQQRLDLLGRRHLAAVGPCTALQALTAGANKGTWSFDAPIDAPSDAIVVEPTAVEVEVAEALAASAAGHASALREAPSREQWSPPLTLEPFAEPESEPVAVLVGDVAVEERGLLGPLVREELRLVVGPLDSFAMVHAFQSKVTGLHGVRRVVVGRFFRGILNLTVDYEGVLPLTTWLPDLGDFAPIAMTQPDHRTIEITLPS